MHVALVNCVLLWWTQVASCANHYRNLMIMVTYVIVKDSFNLVNSPPWATGITFWLNSESSTHRLTLASFWSQLSVSSLEPRLFHSGFLSRSFGEKSEGKPEKNFHVIQWHCDVHQSTRRKGSMSHRSSCYCVLLGNWGKEVTRLSLRWQLHVPGMWACCWPSVATAADWIVIALPKYWS